MRSIKGAVADSTIKSFRRAFYNTPVMHWRVTGYVYDKVFSFGMPDFSSPILFRGVHLFADGKDRSYLPSVVGGYYEKLELDIFTKLVGHSTLMFDIGANIGMYSIIAATENAKITCHAFEPVAENQSLLNQNIEFNGVGHRVNMVPCAVSHKSGKATIHLSDKLSGTHSLSVDRGGSTREIQTVSVDEYCKSRGISPDLIKIDVEGHEASVFKGMKECLKAKPTIFMEYIPELNKDMRELIKQLERIYKHCYVVDTVRGKTKKIAMHDIDPEKMYNIILAKNKKHTQIIDNFVMS